MQENTVIEVVQLKEESLIVVEDQDIYVVSVGSQGPAGAQGLKGDKGDKGDRGESGVGTILIDRKVVHPNSILNIDIVDGLLVRSIKWMITITDQVSQKFQLQELMALNSLNDVNHVSYGIIGESLLYSIQVDRVDGNIVLSVANNDVNDLIIDAIRLGTILI